ncbi:chaperone NapD [Paremcibacter congregatus]|uniref:chaperone NapD n=1 Tax=Paremcibacter congregatus TaxID=2043170 RepID=UPI003A93D149
MNETVGVISSMIVQARPEQIELIKTEIGNFAGAEVTAQDSSGKIIVVLEADTDRQLADTMQKIGEIQGVLGVNLVFHHSEKAN